MVFRVYVEKKAGLTTGAAELRKEISTALGIEGLQSIRIIDRYDAEDIDEQLFEDCIWKVFADPGADNAAVRLQDLPFENVRPEEVISLAADVFAAGPAPGAYDRRAEAAERCIQTVSQGEKPLVRSAAVYVMYGDLDPGDIEAVRAYLTDRTQTEEVSIEVPETLKTLYNKAEDVRTLEGFTTMSEPAMGSCIEKLGLGMDEADLGLCADYFRDTEKRDPTETEIRIIDACWSEPCRHTAVNTVIDSVTFEDPLLEKAYRDYLAVRKDLGKNMPITLSDIATIAVRYLKREGRLDKLEESGNGASCSVMINVEVSGENEPWLLLFGCGGAGAEIAQEPYREAGACIGGCVRDVISGMAYAYSAMRITGSADPLDPDAETLPGMKTQKEITVEAADGCADFINRSGICMGIADEVYHPGYAAGRLEAGAVLAAAPSVNIRKERPEPGDIVMLLGGPSGPSGAGRRSLNTAEERGMQRFFRNSVITRMIKRSCSIGAGGIGAAAGRLECGLDVNLDAVPESRKGLDATELAVRGSGQRLLCVIPEENERLFKLLASDENLQCVKMATVTEEPRLVIHHAGKKAADISREFLDSAGAVRHTDVSPEVPGDWESTSMYGREKGFAAGMRMVAQELNSCSRRGLTERFDSTAGAGTVLMPLGGRNQITPIQAMAHKIPLEKGRTDDCSLMAWGFNPAIAEASPYHGAYLAVVESVAKLIATGASFSDIYLMFREHFGAPGEDAVRWGRPFAAMLGAFEAQMGLALGAPANCETFAGQCEESDVPPSLLSFAVTLSRTDRIISPEFKEAGHRVLVLRPHKETDSEGPGRGLPSPFSLIKVWEKAASLIESGDAVAAYTPGAGGIAEAIMKMTYGNGIGFEYRIGEPDKVVSFPQKEIALEEIFGYSYGSIILELRSDAEVRSRQMDIGLLGYTKKERKIIFADESVSLGELLTLYEGRLDSVFPAVASRIASVPENIEYRTRSWHTTVYKRSEPKVAVPVFPGSGSEYESLRAINEAGASPEVLIINNRSAEDIQRSARRLAAVIRESQMLFIPGGSYAGEEPGGAAGEMAGLLRSEAVSEAIADLLDNRDGLILGTGSGAQALLKTGLVPYGKIAEPDAEWPSFTYNTAGSHRSKIARVRIASTKSPWLRYAKAGGIYSVPVSHAQARFVASDEVMKHLAGFGQIATQYVDSEGRATNDIRFNPSGSMMAVEAITSPDGRVLARMGLAERCGRGLYKNVEGEYYFGMFENAVRYFK